MLFYIILLNIEFTRHYRIEMYLVKFLLLKRVILLCKIPKVDKIGLFGEKIPQILLEFGLIIINKLLE